MQCLSTAIIQHLQLNSESLPLGGYFVPASKPVFSNPTGRPTPLGPDPINSPEVHGDSSNLLRGGSPMTPCRDSSQLRSLFSWTASLPERLQQGLLWDPSVAPYGVQTPGQLLLYTGKADPHTLDSVLLSLQSNLEGHIIALDIRRSEIMTFSETFTLSCVLQPAMATSRGLEVGAHSLQPPG